MKKEGGILSLCLSPGRESTAKFYRLSLTLPTSKHPSISVFQAKRNPLYQHQLPAAAAEKLPSTNAGNVLNVEVLLKQIPACTAVHRTKSRSRQQRPKEVWETLQGGSKPRKRGDGPVRIRLQTGSPLAEIREKPKPDSFDVLFDEVEKPKGRTCGFCDVSVCFR